MLDITGRRCGVRDASDAYIGMYDRVCAMTQLCGQTSFGTDVYGVEVLRHLTYGPDEPCWSVKLSHFRQVFAVKC